MSKKKELDYEFLLDSWQKLVNNLEKVNQSLRDLVIEQDKLIRRLQSTQTVTPKLPLGGGIGIGKPLNPPNVWYGGNSITNAGDASEHTDYVANAEPSES